MTLNKIIMITYPRSGSNLLLESLVKNIKNFTYCYSYDRCNKVPCQCNKSILLTKNHDFNLNHIINDNYKYIIMLRNNPINNIEAYIRYNKSTRINIGKIHYQYPFTKKIKLSLNDIIKEDVIKKYKYYCNFKKKYVNSTKQNIFIIYTEDLINNTNKVIFNLLSFLDLNKYYNKIINYLNREMNFKKKIDENSEIYKKIEEYINI